jgi:chemotaxis protein MotB
VAKKKHADHGGGHGWFVTFADLMGLLMAFFVVLVAFSNQDKQKMQVVAGSMREAFGNQKEIINAGIMDVGGNPARPTPLSGASSPDESSAAAGLDTASDSAADAAARGFARTAASLRQALREMPELADVSNQILVEDSKDGVLISLVDQDGRSMFQPGSTTPSTRVLDALRAIGPTLRTLHYPLSVTGHTASGAAEGADPWRLSADRASVVRSLLAGSGIADGRFRTVEGKAATDPMFPDAPQIAANRRVTIAMTPTPGTLPAGFKP